jgi:hypothetical protein
MNKEMPKLTERGYELAKKLFDIYYPKNKKTEKEKIDSYNQENFDFYLDKEEIFP